MSLLKTLRDHKFTYLINGVLVLIFLVPLAWTLSTSLKSTADIQSYPPRWIPPSPTLEHYREILTADGGAFVGYFVNSILITVGTAVAVVAIGALAGYAFAKLEIPFKGVIFILILTAIMVPFHALLIPLFNLMQNLNLLNTRTALVLIYATFQLPFAIFLMTNAFEAIPGSLREASLVDGSGELGTFVKIFLPVAWPGLATAAIFSAYTTWSDFIVAQVFTTSDKMTTLNVGLTNFAIGQYSTDFGLLSSGAFLSSIPIVILFLLLQRYFVAGLTGGAVK